MTSENFNSVPDKYLTTPKIIGRHGYPAEAHIIRTDDGYLLEYHRIPHAKNAKASTQKYPILLHHGLVDSSVDWVINGPDKSLAYRFADQGYDVWMANARGNTYSRSHISLNPASDKSFWDFTFHEVGVYDLPAAVDYILNATSAEKLIYVGHSLGTTTFYAFAAGRPEYCDKILIQISIAPVAAIPNIASIIRLLVPIAKEIDIMTKCYYGGAFLEYDELTSLVSKYMRCGGQVLNTSFCEQFIMYSLFGKNEDQFNASLVPIITSKMPAGTSAKNMLHVAQLVSSGGEFRHYDYGETENKKRYNTATPPSYNISDISVPMRFFYGQNDLLAVPTDVEILYQQISKPMGLTLIAHDKWNHIDFLWAIDVNKYFNDMLLEFVDNVTTKSDFIMKCVERAVIDRCPPNVRPFDETDFENSVAHIPGLKKIFDDLLKVLKTNVETSINTAKAEVTEKVDGTRTPIKDSVMKSARCIKNSVQKTRKQIHEAVSKGVSGGKKGERGCQTP